MEILLDPRSETPLYQQLRDRMIEAIAAGDLAPGEQLASVRQLAVAFGINVATVGKAYELLREEGFITTSHKSRSVVVRGPASGPPADGFVDGWASRLTTLLAEAVAQGLPPSDIAAHTSRIVASFDQNRSDSSPDTATAKDPTT
ncbi:GntR family transcriptional regulator [Parafrigoribacterium soli]|uniref:GntR family transcriptional regulator n=1 Tax=Parafrigoribacterium soli TaxID=3144663 RepID=UPI0032EAFD25